MNALIQQILQPAAETEGGLGNTASPTLWRVFLVQVPVLTLLMVLPPATVWLDVPMSGFMRDPAAIAGIHPLNGLVSSLGVILWSAAAGIMLFGACLCRRTGETRRMLLYFGVLTIVLLLDDMFLVHEELAPRFLSISEEPIYALYAGMLLYGLFRYRGALWPRGGPLLVTASLCFAVALGSDMVLSSGAAWAFWLEDGAKLLGIANWGACFALLAADAVRGGTTNTTEGGSHA